MERKKLPDTRPGLTHKFTIGEHKGYITVGLYEDGAPGEIFLTMAKTGSTLNGMIDTLAAAISISLQYGVPLEAFCRKFRHYRFEPSGFTANPEIKEAASITDYVFTWLQKRYCPP